MVPTLPALPIVALTRRLQPGRHVLDCGESLLLEGKVAHQLVHKMVLDDIECFRRANDSHGPRFIGHFPVCVRRYKYSLVAGPIFSPVEEAEPLNLFF